MLSFSGHSQYLCRSVSELLLQIYLIRTLAPDLLCLAFSFRRLFRNCGIIFGYEELFTSESMSQVFAFLLGIVDYASAHGIRLPQFGAYDDACHLVKFLQKRKGASPRAAALAAIDWCIDRFHFPNHVDKWWLCLHGG